MLLRFCCFMVDPTSITLHLQSQRRLRSRTQRILVPRMGPWLLETATAPLRPGSQWRLKLQTLAVRAKLQHKTRRCLYPSCLPWLRSLIRKMRLDMVIAFPVMATRISSNVLLCFSQLNSNQSINQYASLGRRDDDAARVCF